MVTMTLKSHYEGLNKDERRKLVIKIQLALGVSQITTYNYISGKTTPKLLYQKEISKITGVPTAQLFPSEA